MVKFSLKIAQAVRRRPLTVEPLVRSQASPCEVCGGRSGSGRSFSVNISVFPCQDHSTKVPYSFSCTSCCYQRDKQEKTGNLAKSSVLPETEKHWIEKYC
jgi:hypothetical protein